MIHQLIFAAPKPGMSAQEFQDYWVNVHAVKYASKISQIKKYLIDTRVPFQGDFGNPPLPHQGVAEIWINPEDQIASLESNEFLQGARLDEPNWAAFWMTFVLDTNSYLLYENEPEKAKVKMILLLRRKEGVRVDEFRDYGMKNHAGVVSKLPGLRKYVQCHTVDGAYVFGESAPFDGAEMFSFDDVASLQAALDSEYCQNELRKSLASFASLQYLFSLTAEEHWIIGPNPR